ncbi:MAG: class I SAM-dependent methyltransferase [Crocinitomicaceae bacterium]|nr:class I SAM-dependent methyltransferase [Crocinitomicaceae bacterium]
MFIFTHATQCGWYSKFLEPVVLEINSGPIGITLDIGTGPGTLPLMLKQVHPTISIIGIDPDPQMIRLAKKQDKKQQIQWLQQTLQTYAPSKIERPRNIVFCSMLYLLTEKEIEKQIRQALHILHKEGQILVLSPKGDFRIWKAFIYVWQYPFSWKNYTYFFWKFFVSFRGRFWTRKKYLLKIADKFNLTYDSKIVFQRQAILEILKPSNQ